MESSNDCVPRRQRYNIAIRNDYITIGRNFNKADYFTNDISNEGEYLHQDFKLMLMKVIETILELVTQIELSKNLNVAFGIDVEKQYYNTSSWQNVEGTETVTELTLPLFLIQMKI